MTLNAFGEIAYHEWIKLAERFTNFELDVFQIMPNHMHGIIVLNHVGATLVVAQNDVRAKNNGQVVAQNNRNENGQPQGVAENDRNGNGQPCVFGYIQTSTPCVHFTTIREFSGFSPKALTQGH